MDDSDDHELFLNGDYYRLSSPFENHDFTAWSYVSPDRERACLSVVYTDLHGNARPRHLLWKGLDPEAGYRLRRVLGAAVDSKEPVHGGNQTARDTEDLTNGSAAGRNETADAAGGEIYTGVALMQGGIILPKPTRDYDSCMMAVERV